MLQMEPNSLLQPIDQGDCPYLPRRRWVSHAFAVSQMPAAIHQRLIDRGWRRSGEVLYCNRCPGCSLCIPLRTDAGAFLPSRSQRRVLRKNGDVRVTYHDPEPDDELFSLYLRYQRARHGGHDSESQAREAFERFLCRSPVPSAVMKYHLRDQLIGAGWVDLLPDGVSSVYFVFDPEQSRRSLGVYSAMQELAFASRRGNRWLYFGFFVPGCPAMSYKAKFRPYQLLIDGAWRSWESTP